MTSLGCNTGAEAEFPTGSPPGPGPAVWLNSDSQWCLSGGNVTPSHSQRIYAVTHELGHTLGLRHTNWHLLGEPVSQGAYFPDGTYENISGANHIDGTPLCDTSSDCDSQSVMNGGTLGVLWGGFSNADIIAIQTLYPVQLNLTIASYPLTLTWDPVPNATSYSISLYYQQYTTYEDGSSAWQPYEEFRGTTTNTSYFDGSGYTGTDDCYAATFRCNVVYSVYANFSVGQSAPGSVAPLVAQ